MPKISDKLYMSLEQAIKLTELYIRLAYKPYCNLITYKKIQRVVQILKIPKENIVTYPCACKYSFLFSLECCPRILFNTTTNKPVFEQHILCLNNLWFWSTHLKDNK